MDDVLAQVGRYGFEHMSGWGWVPGVVGLVFMALVIGLVVWLIWSLVRRDQMAKPGTRTALVLLDERYARGEIDREEYLQRKADLGG